MRGIPSTDGTKFEVLERWHENELAERKRFAWKVEHLVSIVDHVIIVHAITLLDVERLAGSVVPGTEAEASRYVVGGHGVTWLRMLIEHGYRFVWSTDAIRQAEADEAAVIKSEAPR